MHNGKHERSGGAREGAQSVSVVEQIARYQPALQSKVYRNGNDGEADYEKRNINVETSNHMSSPSSPSASIRHSSANIPNDSFALAANSMGSSSSMETPAQRIERAMAKYKTSISSNRLSMQQQNEANEANQTDQMQAEPSSTEEDEKAQRTIRYAKAVESLPDMQVASDTEHLDDPPRCERSQSSHVSALLESPKSSTSKDHHTGHQSHEKQSDAPTIEDIHKPVAAPEPNVKSAISQQKPSAAEGELTALSHGSIHKAYCEQKIERLEAKLLHMSNQMEGIKQYVKAQLHKDILRWQSAAPRIQAWWRGILVSLCIDSCNAAG